LISGRARFWNRVDLLGVGEIDVRSDDATAVAAHDLHCNTGSTLQATSNIVPVLGETERDLRIDT